MTPPRRCPFCGVKVVDVRLHDRTPILCEVEGMTVVKLEHPQVVISDGSNACGVQLFREMRLWIPHGTRCQQIARKLTGEVAIGVDLAQGPDEVVVMELGPGAGETTSDSWRR